MRVLRDCDVEREVTPEMAAASMRAAVVAAWRGELVAPPRAAVALGDRRLTFTCGRVPGEWFGYRAYVAPGDGDDDQLVVVQDETTGQVRGVATGRALSPRRVGGIGAVAVDALAPDDPGHIAVIGAGTQAWHQLWALPQRLRHLPIQVASRSPDTRDAFIARARRQLNLDTRPASTSASAARDAGVVIMATASSTPVLRGSEVRPGACVTTLGPKQVGRAEFGPDLVAGAALVVSDSPAQIAHYEPPNVLAGTVDDVLHLGAVLTGEHPVPLGIRVFLSVGLAGTEAWLLNDILAVA